MAMVVRKGNADAGAIFVLTRRPDGRVALYGPSPELETGIRRWRLVVAEAAEAESLADKRLVREADIDPDLWIVEIEDREGRHFLGEFLEAE